MLRLREADPRQIDSSPSAPLKARTDVKRVIVLNNAQPHEIWPVVRIGSCGKLFGTSRVTSTLAVALDRSFFRWRSVPPKLSVPMPEAYADRASAHLFQ